ncbi:MAG: asparagine synthase (glutamine-hydrolyzing) [Pseudomonadota bacterium]
MCGITGIVAPPDAAVELKRIQAMCDVMVHRGPDDEGSLIKDHVGLGMRRLSIIDLHSGNQPVHNEDKTVWVVLNGEIYNYRELRDELEKKGHSFYTESDTEVLVHLYEELGDAFVGRLSGMFGIALYDVPRQRVLIARDRIGEKQIYYAETPHGLVFGSEIKCVLASGRVEADLDVAAVSEYLRYLYIPAPRTIYRQIRELPPGSLMVVDKGQTPRVSAYWTLERPEERISSEAEAIERVRDQLSRSVESRLVSDVPVGALLSGGIDSSAVVANMVRASSQPVRTFTIGYAGEASVYDERSDARLIAEHLGTEHHELVIEPDLEDVIPKLVRAFDQPFADSSAVANYYVFQATSEHVKVVLSGLGGDELFAGYERHLAIRRHASLSWIPPLLRTRLIPGLVGLLPDPKSGARIVDRAKRFSAALKLPVAEAYEAYMTSFTPPQQQALLHGDVQAQLASQAPDTHFLDNWRRFEDMGPVEAATSVDMLTYLPGDLLTLTDRMSMQHSIEARAPLIDYELIDLAMSIPGYLRIAGAEKKRILREVVRKEIPPEILDRPKRGFTLPITNWFRGELKTYLRDMLSERRIRETGVFNHAAVERLIDEHVSMRQNHHARLWALLMFVVWQEQQA